MKPVLAEIKEEYGDVFNFEFVEVRVNRQDPKVKQFIEEFNVSKHPVIYIVDSVGKIKKEFVGRTPITDITNELERALEGGN